MTILPQLIKKTQGQFFQTALASKNNICLVDLFELAVVQLCIESVLCQQFFVVALLYNIAVFHNEDQIGILDRRKSVGDDERSTSSHQLVHSILDQLLGSGIDR